MRADRVIRQKSHTAARVLRRAWKQCREDSLAAGAAVISGTMRSLLRPRTRRVASEFDEKYGVDTGGVIPLSSLDVSSPNYVYGVYYKASRPDELRDVLSAIPLRHEEFTFVDFGSGKGLALLMASFFPFRRIVGVEFAADLHRVAESNIAKFCAEGMQCRDIRSVHADAAEWAVPEEPLLCYFYEPFEAPVLARTLARLRASFAQRPRPLVIVYHHTNSASVLHEGSLENERLIAASGLFQYAGWQREPYSVYVAGMTMSAETLARRVAEEQRLQNNT